ncbi:hypothetical protein GCM10011579_057910 [Streptomyces albiflavescens]|uniref:Uncharacterized protein n=1 Tax=Streptomyces albiflavescens TaxID=1623582 RepID=A0A917Y8U4_9ACTN|nr:DUF6308 family protein [Streptomyces albiflavescens]GGN76617.1 hypothetical protein GCM10011579_057910 [Streptomyces albiflavescens]
MRFGLRARVGAPVDLGGAFWLDLHGALRADNHALHRELMALRQSADLPATVSALRVCDVVLWMYHRTDHRQRSCIGT